MKAVRVSDLTAQGGVRLDSGVTGPQKELLEGRRRAHDVGSRHRLASAALARLHRSLGRYSVQ